ncbi:uncharacterized protein ACNS7B_023475 isoform 1-T1 [Menidia menidia]
MEEEIQEMRELIAQLKADNERLRQEQSRSAPGNSLPESLQLMMERQDATQAAITVLPERTTKDMQVLQHADPVLQELWTFWARKKQPDRIERKNLSLSLLAFLRQWDRLVEKDGVLHRKIFRPDGAEETLQLLLPTALREEVLTQAHQDHGHQGYVSDAK